MRNTTDKMTVQVIVKGRPVKTYTHNGHTYIEGKERTQYSIRIHNNTYGRICTVVSVDGLDVISGERATPSSQGYLISSKSYIDIEGFRTSEDYVGAFKFSTKGNSYATTKGKEAAQNVGIIGVIAYDEKAQLLSYEYPLRCFLKHEYRPVPLAPVEPYWTSIGDGYCCNSDSITPEVVTTACANPIRSEYSGSVRYCATINDAPKKLACFDMGTTWGDKVSSKVTHSKFNRNEIVAEHEIRYASRNALLSMGIDLYPKTSIEQMPSAFDRQFAKPPAGWP